MGSTVEILLLAQDAASNAGQASTATGGAPTSGAATVYVSIDGKLIEQVLGTIVYGSRVNSYGARA
jgi:hypothetical protein